MSKRKLRNVTFNISYIVAEKTAQVAPFSWNPGFHSSSTDVVQRLLACVSNPLDGVLHSALTTQSSSFEMVLGHRIFRIFYKHSLTKVCSLVVNSFFWYLCF